MAAGELVRIRNNGDKPFTMKYNGQTATIAPGSEKFVPWEMMCLWMGHPEAMDIDARRRHRTQENKRLRTKYGAYEVEERWQQNKPNIEAFDFDGEKIITVLDDPVGAHLSPASLTERENTLLTERLQRLEAELRSLRQHATADEAPQAQVQADLPAAGPVPPAKTPDAPAAPSGPVPVDAPPDDDEPSEDKPKTVKAGA